METINKANIDDFDFEQVSVDSFWNTGEEKEQKMHRIHTYPAKFPAFITTKALNFVKNEYDMQPHRIADIFCGCGTTAFEAKRNDIKFWGCDINPVATLITEVKKGEYEAKRLKKYYEKILEKYNNNNIKDTYENAPERLKYWYSRKQYTELAHLKKAIISSTSKNQHYKNFFLCAFSNILKPASKWLMRSIKPQIDPHKNPVDVIQAFKKQFNTMMTANNDKCVLKDSESEIITCDFLNYPENIPSVDMIITSPPYVTSYEYADLHQLSSLWLGYVKDYKELRDGAIGSLRHNTRDFDQELKKLNATGRKIVLPLCKKSKSQAKSVTKYFLDMQKVAEKSFSILKEKGVALFVIGNTEYKDIRIDNAKHLSEALLAAGFSDISATKRNISNKILTPYRDKTGRFSSNRNDRKIYTEEFILIGRKKS